MILEIKTVNNEVIYLNSRYIIRIKEITNISSTKVMEIKLSNNDESYCISLDSFKELKPSLFMASF